MSDYNTPITTIVTVINGNLDNANIAAAAAISGSKLADATITAAKIIGIDKSITTTDSNPYKFSVYRNSAWTAATNTFGKVAYDTEDFDTNNNFTGGTYTCPVPGFYWFEGTAGSVFNNGANGTIAIYKNGSEVKRGNQVNNMGLTSTNTVNFVVTSLLSCAANDTIEIWHSGNAGAGSTGTSTHFSGYLVSRT